MPLRCTAHIARALCPLGTPLLNSLRGIEPHGCLCSIGDCFVIASALFHTPVILPSISNMQPIHARPRSSSASPSPPLLGFGHAPLLAVGLGCATTDITSSDNTLVSPQRKEQAFSRHRTPSTIFTLLGLYLLLRLSINTQRQASKSLRRGNISNMSPLGHTLLRPGNPCPRRIIDVDGVMHDSSKRGRLAGEIGWRRTICQLSALLCR